MTFYDIKKSFLSWSADIRIYKGGLILFGNSHYKIKGNHEREILKCVQPGDIILRRYDHYLGTKAISLFSGTYWSHSAIYIGEYEGATDRVIHMLGDGVTNDDLLTFMRCDDIKILRCQNIKYINKAIELAKYYYEKAVKYDYSFDFDNDTFYCSEFIKECYPNAKFYNRVSERIIYPDDFLKSIFYTVWERNRL